MMYLHSQASHEIVSSIINRGFYDLFKQTEKRLINRFNISPERQVALHHHGSVRGATCLDAVEKLAGVGPGKRHIRNANRPAVEPDLAAIECDRPFKVPVVKHPERSDAGLSDVLPNGPVASRQDKRLLDETARSSL